jgi:hypothetical protein
MRSYLFPYFVSAAFFVFSTFVFTVRHRITNRSHISQKEFINQSVNAVQGCKNVYLRVRPDPYFHLRAEHPEIRVFEFIPGKLRLEKAPERLFHLDCYLIDANGTWEPTLTQYLAAHQDEFTLTKIDAHTIIPEVYLWRRK